MRLSAFKELTRFEQTLFGLPFIVSGASLTLPNCSPSTRWIWILPAFLLARISGMVFNQLIDRHIDAQNPRTKNRAIPSGRVTKGQACCVAWGSLLIFLIVCMQINWLTACLAVVAAFLLYIYSYMKRIHYSCHVILGCIHFLGPIMAYAAITGTLSLASIFLGGAACLLITGNDIVYAIQDYEFDRTHKIFSLPAKFGIEQSLAISALFHFCSLLMLLGIGLTAHFTIFYYLIVPIAGTIFFYFHRILYKTKHSVKEIESSFFICTVAISFSTLFFVILSSFWVSIQNLSLCFL